MRTPGFFFRIKRFRDPRLKYTGLGRIGSGVVTDLIDRCIRCHNQDLKMIHEAGKSALPITQGQADSLQGTMKSLTVQKQGELVAESGRLGKELEQVEARLSIPLPDEPDKKKPIKNHPVSEGPSPDRPDQTGKVIPLKKEPTEYLETRIQANCHQAESIVQKLKWAFPVLIQKGSMWLILLGIDVVLMYHFFEAFSLDKMGELSAEKALLLMIQAMIVVGACLVLEKAVSVIPPNVRRGVYILAGVAALLMLWNLGMVREMITWIRAQEVLVTQNQDSSLSQAEKGLLEGTNSDPQQFRAAKTSPGSQVENGPVISAKGVFQHYQWFALAFPLITLGCAISYLEAARAARLLAYRKQAWAFLDLVEHRRELQARQSGVKADIQTVKLSETLLLKLSQDLILNAYQAGLVKPSRELSNYERYHATAEDRELINRLQVHFLKWLAYTHIPITRFRLDQAHESIKKLNLISLHDSQSAPGNNPPLPEVEAEQARPAA